MEKYNTLFSLGSSTSEKGAKILSQPTTSHGSNGSLAQIISQKLFADLQKLVEMFREYSVLLDLREDFEAQVQGFEIREQMKSMRVFHRMTNSDIIDRLPSDIKAMCESVLHKSFVRYDSAWLKPNGNFKPKGFKTSPEQHRISKQRRVVQLSRQQQRKLKRSLFGVGPDLEYQMMKPDIVKKTESCIEEVSGLVGSLDKLINTPVPIEAQTVPLQDAVANIVGQIASIANTTGKGVSDLSIAVESLVDKFAGQGDRKEAIQAMVDNICNQYASAKESAFGLRDEFTATVDMIKRWLYVVGDGMALMCFVYCGAAYAWTRSPAYAMVGAAVGIYLAYRNQVTLSSVFKGIREYFNPSKVEKQIGASSIYSFVNLLFAVCHISTADKGRMDKLASFLSTSDRRTSTLEATFAWCKDVALYLYNIIMGSLGLEKIYQFQTGIAPEADSIFVVYERLLKAIDIGEFKHNETTYNVLMDLSKSCQQFLRATHENSANRALLREVWGVQTFCTQKRKEMADSHWQHMGYRPEPVCLVLLGEPGVGKTQSVEFITADFCGRTLPETEVDRLATEGTTPFVYIRQDENEYWEGYRSSHVVTVIDDLGQRRTNVGDDDAFFNLIRAVNSFPYQLHMAELTKKENTMFRSKLVICTTNLIKFEPISLVSSDAIARRLQFKFKVMVHKAYATPEGRIDEKKLPKDEFGVPVFDPAVVNYYISVDDKGDPMVRDGRTCHSFDQLMDMVQEHAQIKTMLRDSKQFRVNKLIELRLRERGLGRAPASEYEVPMEPVEPEYQAHNERSSAPKDYVDWIERSIRTFKAQTPDEHISESNFTLNQLLKRNWDYELLVANYARFYHLGMLHDMTKIGFLELERNLLSHGELYNWWLDTFGAKVDWKTRMWEAIQTFCSHTHKTLVVGITKAVNFLSSTFSVAIGLIDSLLEMLGLDKATVFFTLGSIGAVWAIRKSYVMFSTSDLDEIDENDLSNSHVQYYDQLLAQSGKLKKVKQQRKANILNRQGKEDTSPVTERSIAELVRDNTYSIYHFRYTHEKGLKFRDDAKQLEYITCCRKLKDSGQTKSDEVILIGSGIFVASRYFLMPTHFSAYLANLVADGPAQGDDKVVLLPHGPGKTAIVVNMSDFRTCFVEKSLPKEDNTYMTSDRSLTHFGRHVPLHRDITKHFVSEKDNLDNGLSGSMDTVSGNHETKVCLVTKDRKLFIAGDDVNDPTVLEAGFAYRMPTQQGDCGQPLIIARGKSSRACVGGIHVSGVPAREMGFAQKVTKEWLEEFVWEHSMEYGTGVPEFTVNMLNENEKLRKQGNFDMVGFVLQPHSPYGKTKLEKSEIHPDVIPSYATSLERPAVLMPGPTGDPYEKALSAYCGNDVLCFGKEIDIAVSVFSKYFNRFIDGDRRILTFEESVRGIEGDPHFGSINRSSSAGYPFNVFNISKKDIFGPEGEFNLETEWAIELREEVERTIDHAVFGKRRFHVYSDNLKDEKLPHAKVDIGKTRLFCGAPLAYTLACRMAFGAFMSYVQRHSFELGTAIGLNPYSHDWDAVARKLMEKGHGYSDCRYGAGDYSRFDGSEVAYIHWKILDVINQWYGNDEGGNRIRTILWLDLVNSRHHKGLTIYEWRASLPSGHPLTSIVNSMYNHIAMNYCYLKLSMEIEPDICPLDFYDRVYLVVMGDDNLFGVTAETTFFNETSISRHMSSLGLTYTSDTKSGTNDSLRSLSEVTFLKRRFRVERDLKMPYVWNKFCAPLDMNTILETPFWYKKSIATPEMILRQNLETSFRELSLHGRVVFEEWVPKMIETYKRRRSASPYDELEYTDFDSARIAVSGEQFIW